MAQKTEFFKFIELFTMAYFTVNIIRIYHLLFKTRMLLHSLPINTLRSRTFAEFYVFLKKICILLLAMIISIPFLFFTKDSDPVISPGLDLLNKVSFGFGYFFVNKAAVSVLDFAVKWFDQDGIIELGLSCLDDEDKKIK